MVLSAAKHLDLIPVHMIWIFFVYHFSLFAYLFHVFSISLTTFVYTHTPFVFLPYSTRNKALLFSLKGCM